MSEALYGLRFRVTGVVQGVGFRPFVYGLAQQYHLTGWVKNTSTGVVIEINGKPATLERFHQDLIQAAPPLARLDFVDVEPCAVNGYPDFRIVPSESQEDAFQPVSPDVSLCDDCYRELFDVTNRRFRYPFINCTNCGPRFTIIRDMPYDRPQTTMAPFPMCSDCAEEYYNPLDRRFHAQPIACETCGPQIWLEWSKDKDEKPAGEAALQIARDILAQGGILAVKGLGGFHLACDALNESAVRELRRRKLRRDKPFALMMADLKSIEKHCYVNSIEAKLLQARERPVVILEKRADSPIAAACAPGQNNLGVMLTYTPLHALLLEPAEGFPEALVMTSGNLSEEPIATGNEEARQRLTSLADALLLHNRDIYTRCDDSVVRQSPIYNAEYPLRRSRGFAPYPVKLPCKIASLLATGAELKNTFCVTRDQYAFLSHHIGDLENYETLQAFEDGIEHLQKLFHVRPEAIAYDLHPDYLATRYALERAVHDKIPAIGVQHHHAHIAAGMVEHGFTGDRPVIGVCFDGTGYGLDGTIWGGEFLIADYQSFSRPYYLRPVALPGGDKAIKEPWRHALSWLHASQIPWEDLFAPVNFALNEQDQSLDPLQIIHNQIKTGFNAPLTSSMGRLFDAVAALVGIRQTVNYEAQAAIELEALVQPTITDHYMFDIDKQVIDPSPLFQAIVYDLRTELSIADIATRFHNGVAMMVQEICKRMRQNYGLNDVVLSGGVWQNMSLIVKTLANLEKCGFSIYIHQKVPTNDGGLSLGQAVIAAKKQAA